MDDWASGFVETNGVRLHYLRSGGAMPPLVLAHGGLEDARCWAPAAEALAADHDVIAIDARGHGRSDSPTDGYDLATQAEDLAGAIAALGLEKPALLGHSLGAEAALVLAGAHPQLLRGIVLEDPGPWWMGWPATDEEKTALTVMRERYEQYPHLPREVLLADRRQRSPNWTEGERAAWVDAKLRASQHAFAVFDPELDAGIDWPTVLSRITCRALLIHTDVATGGMVGPESVATLQALVPHLAIAHIPGASHSIRRSNLTHFMAVVGRFLAS